MLGNGFGLFINDAPNTIVPPAGTPEANTIAGNVAVNVYPSHQGNGDDAVLLQTSPVVSGPSITAVVLSFKPKRSTRPRRRTT